MKNKRKVNDLVISYRQKLLATSIAALCTGMVSSSVTQASDIDIYQEAKSGQITLMMMMDISTSMNRASTARSDLGLSSTDCGNDKKNITAPDYGYTRDYCVVSSSRLTILSGGDTASQLKATKVKKACNIQSNGDYHCGDRTARMKDALYELLNGSTVKNVTALDDAKVIGLSTFGAKSGTGYQNVGAILVPARALGQTVGTQTQRQILTSTIQGLTGISSTPTALGYAEVINYLMGQRPAKTTGFNLSDSLTKIGTGSAQKYETPTSLSQSNETKKCSGQGVYVLTDGQPNSLTTDTLSNMRTGLNKSSFNCTTNNTWDCQLKGAVELVEKRNPLALEIRTAVVGFGKDFESVTSYDKKKTQQQNIDALGGCTASGCSTNEKNAALWGILGSGGWYSGSSSQDVVNSVNSFLGDLNKGIPAVTTGSPTIPKDSLNPSVLQKHAYYPQFQPTPDKAYQLWAGNLRKYDVVNGILKDKSGLNIVDSTGKLLDNYDLWSPAVSNDTGIAAGDVNTQGSKLFAQKGGVWSQLKLRDTTNVENRKLLTNRVQTSGSGTTTTFGDSSTLRQVKISDLTDVPYKYDADRGYLISLLGYAIDATKPDLINLTTAPELRQIGAVMHSSPVLITNKGTITYTNNILGSANREDYVLFGTTQGLLHVVDAKTGQEKFAFVPNEMVKNQKQAFINYDKTDGGIDKLFYGIDGAWTSYTEYVIDSNGNLTVETGRGLNQEGKQFVYGGLRMGGRSYYALDLKNIDAPKLQFQISPDDQKVYYNGSSKSFSQLQYMGQSWSKPTIAWVRWGNQRKRVMFVGGGYDAAGSVQCGDATHNDPALTGYDSLNRYNNKGYECPNYNQSNQVGAGVYMFDADNGDLLWWASANATNTTSGVIGLKNDNLKYSVVSEIRNEDRDGDGLADHLYFGDLGGQLFRIDLDNKAASTATFAKTPRRLLNLNASGKSPRFYEMPAFSIYRYAGETFGVISIGSGNRSTPLLEYTVGTAGYDYDAVYNIYDKDVAAKDLYDSTHVFKTENLLKSDLGEVTQANRNDDTNLVAPYTAKGWYYRFQSNKLQSAKVFATPIVLNSRLFVSTFDASKPGLSGDCGAGVKGESFLNQFCMPFGQCPKPDLNSSIPEPECSTGDGCSIGPGIQNTAVVDSECDPATDPTCTKGGNKPPKPEDGTNNKNYCISTGNRSVTKGGGTIPAGTSKMCLIPQRWYERSR